MTTLFEVLALFYVFGFVWYFMKNAICSCGEHIIFIGILESFVWFIIVPIRYIQDVIFDYKYLRKKEARTSK